MVDGVPELLDVRPAAGPLVAIEIVEVVRVDAIAEVGAPRGGAPRCEQGALRRERGILRQQQQQLREAQLLSETYGGRKLAQADALARYLQ